jgi:hypothetical protein
MHRFRLVIPIRATVTAAAACAILAVPPGRVPGGEPDRAQVEFFETKIRPVLVEHCYKCHSAQAAKLKGGLRLDTRDGLRKGGDSGPAIVPGDPAGSLLLNPGACEASSNDATQRVTYKAPSEPLTRGIAPPVLPASGRPRQSTRRVETVRLLRARSATNRLNQRFIAPSLPSSGR